MTAYACSAEHILHVVFTAKAPEEWQHDPPQPMVTGQYTTTHANAT